MVYGKTKYLIEDWPEVKIDDKAGRELFSFGEEPSVINDILTASQSQDNMSPTHLNNPGNLDYSLFFGYFRP